MNNNTCCQYICCIGRNSVIKTNGVDVIGRSHATFNITDVSVVEHDSLMVTPLLKSKGMQKKESIMIVWCG